MPPTNRWYSSLAYADLPAKAYPSPVAVAVDAGSLTVGLPKITASDKVISAQTGPGIGLTIEGSATRPLVAVNDPVWTSLDYMGADGGTLATATVAQGWPAVGLVAETGLTLTLDTAVDWESKPSAPPTSATSPTSSRRLRHGLRHIGESRQGRLGAGCARSRGHRARRLRGAPHLTSRGR